MVTHPSTTPWPPVLGTPATESLAVAFAGFDGAVGRLAEAMHRTAPVDSPPPDLTVGNVELSAALWFARTAVEQIGKREWPGGWGPFVGQLTPDDNTLLLAFSWARNHAGHALAAAAHVQQIGIYLEYYTDHYPWVWSWRWADRATLPTGQRDPNGEAAYDGLLAGQELIPTLQAMAAWLTTTDRTLTK